MTYPLMALALGAVVAGFVGIPAALWSNGPAIERFLEPSFTAEARPSTLNATAAAPATTAGAESTEAGARREPAREAEPAGAEHETEHASRGLELGLMGFSVLIALAGIGLAWKFYVTSPEISERLAQNWAGAHRLLSNKY